MCRAAILGFPITRPSSAHFTSGNHLLSENVYQCGISNNLMSTICARTYFSVFFFSSHYTTPAQCWAQDLARGLNSSRSSWVQGCGRMGQTSRCFMVCSSPHSHIVCPSSLDPHFCIRDLYLPVPVRWRFRLDQVGHASLKHGGSDSLGLNESLCGVVWRWLDQRFSLRVRALPSRGSTEWRKLCRDFSLFLAGSCP